VPDIGHLQAAIARFNSRHDVTEDQQFKTLNEEVSELAEALNTDGGQYEIAAELADVIFVARSLAELRDINITHEVASVTEENLQKDESTEGQKITKSSVSHLSHSDASTGTKVSDTSYGVTDD